MKTAPSRDAGTLLKQLDQANVFSTDEDTARVVFSAAASVGFNAYRIDLSLATTSKKLFQILGCSLHFPDWFGDNWDALADCLSDMSWSEADGYVLLLQCLEDLQRVEAETVTKFFDLLRDAANNWRTQGVPFWVLVESPISEGALGALPQFRVES